MENNKIKSKEKLSINSNDNIIEKDTKTNVSHNNLILNIENMDLTNTIPTIITKIQILKNDITCVIERLIMSFKVNSSLTIKIMSYIIIGLILLFLLFQVLSYLMFIIKFLSDILIMIMLSTKILLHVLSSKKEKNHGDILSKQILVTFFIKILLIILPFFEYLPIFNTISSILQCCLILLLIAVQIPMAILNYSINQMLNKLIFVKFNTSINKTYINVPLADSIMKYIIVLFNNTKILSIVQSYYDTFIKYETTNEFNIDDINIFVKDFDVNKTNEN